MARFFIAAAVAAIAVNLSGAPAFAQSAESAVTALDLKKCRHTRGKVEEDYGSWRCSGYNGIAVYVAAGDQRSYVSFGPKAKDEPAAKQTLASFNGEGKSIEWRLQRGADKKAVPYAAIMRWSTTVSTDDRPVRGQVLVVMRLAPGPVCHVGYVDAGANPDANALAQKIADERARDFRCGTDKAIVMGKKGPGFSGPYGD
ncbi:MAG: hypothetical protein WCI56_03885 [Hyphomicrobiales bacterium]